MTGQKNALDEKFNRMVPDNGEDDNMASNDDNSSNACAGRKW